MQIADLYTLFLKHPQVSTDTRQIKADSMFFALKGANFNGNAFAAQALENGAAYAVIDEVAYKADGRFLLVDDVLVALQDLARYHRRQLTIPVIGVTGTNGKTTTKELLYAVLSQRFKTLATAGNLNNHIGVPLTILSITSETAIAIIEMGANHIGEIAFLCGIAQPTHGLITNVGKAHLEGFGSFEGVKKTKAELYDWLATHGGTLFRQGDNPFLSEMATGHTFLHEVTYGLTPTNAVYGQVTETSPLLSLYWQEQHGNTHGHEVHTRLTGAYNAENILAAVCTGLQFGVPVDAINEGITAYVPKNNRSQMNQTASNLLICDYYNANASSMAAALDNLTSMQARHKVVVLGDMFELGSESFDEHHKLVQQVSASAFDKKIFVGEAFYQQKNSSADFYKSTDELIAVLKEHPVTDALVLLKASRGMAFEKLLPYF